jgi:hypothetical protein
MYNMATAASNAGLLFELPNSATRAASTNSVVMQPRIPAAIYLFRGKRSTIGIAMTLIPKLNVNHAAVYKSCLTGEKPRFL